MEQPVEGASASSERARPSAAAEPSRTPPAGPPPRGDGEVARILGIDRRGQVKRWLRRIVWIGVLVAIVWFGKRFLDQLNQPVPIQYQTAAVERGDLVTSVTATGTLEPVNVVDVGPEISGRVARVLVDFNDPVTAGQTLAELDTDLLEAQVAQVRAEQAIARAAQAEAEATVTEARATRDRIESLFDRELATAAERESAEASVLRAEAAVDTAAARVRAARAAQEIAEANLARAVIRSPIDGVVLSRNVEEGTPVVSQFQAQMLFRIAEDLTRMELHAQVDEADIGQVEVGQEATFSVAAFPERDFAASVRSIRNAPQSISNVVTYITILDVSNDELLLRPGMTATVEVVTARFTDRLLVPNAALRFTPPPMALATGTGEGTAEGTAAGTGEASTAPGARDGRGDEGMRVWILRDGRPTPIAVVTGPTDGNRTIIEPQPALEPGTPLLVDIEMPAP